MDPNENKFNYDLDAVRVRELYEEMINSLREFHAEIRRPFTTGLFDKWEKKICGSQAISRRFGSWREALSKIGINRGIQAHTYTREVIG